MVNVTVTTKELKQQLQTCTHCDKKETTPSDASKNDSANRNVNATAMRIIIDLHSYINETIQKNGTNNKKHSKNTYTY
jgi:hypothetical protein